MKYIVGICSALLLIAGLLAAGTEPAAEDTPAHVFIIDNGSCAQRVSYEGVMQASLNSVNQTGAQLGAILVGGQPDVYMQAVEIPRLPQVTKTRLSGRLESSNSPFLPLLQIDAAMPSSPEKNWIESFRAAGVMLNSPENRADQRSLYLSVFGTGIETSDPALSFTRNILTTDYQSVIDAMHSLGVLPNLTNVHLTWYGCTQLTATPQVGVPYKYVPLIKDFWRYFLEKCGAESVAFEDVITPNINNLVVDGYPFTTPVFFETNGIFDGGCAFYTLPESVLKFKPDLSDFADGSNDPNPGDVLEPLARYLAQSNQKVVLLGTTAYSSNRTHESLRTLSWERANRVKTELVALGCNPDNIIVAGAGSEAVSVRVGDKVIDFYKNDQDEYGRQVDTIAANNRAVHVISHEDAAEIIERFGSN